MLAIWAPPAVAADGTTVLVLPHALQPGEIAFIQVTVGAIARGQEVEVATMDGRAIGTVSPFGIRAGQQAGTYTMPVPPEAIRDGKLSLRLRITQFDGPPRLPTSDEVKDVQLVIAGTRP